MTQNTKMSEDSLKQVKSPNPKDHPNPKDDKGDTLKQVRSPKTAKRKRGRPPGRKNNSTIVKEQAKEVAAEIYGKELEDIKKHAEETVQTAIYTNIGPIIEKMAQQAIEGNFSQQKEFLKRVSPETKAIDPDKVGGNFTININVAEYTRDEPIIINQTADAVTQEAVTKEKEDL